MSFVQQPARDSPGLSPSLYVIFVWSNRKIGSSEVALMEHADLVLLKRANNAVGDASVVEQH
jgi:hypothetical protein